MNEIKIKYFKLLFHNQDKKLYAIMKLDILEKDTNNLLYIFDKYHSDINWDLLIAKLYLLPENIIIKSMYCNYHTIIGEEISDCKVHNQKSVQLVRLFMQGKLCLSNSQYSLRVVLPVLQELFPNPSKYEL